MPKEKLPKLTEAQIRALASAKSFERGQSYYQDGALVEPLRQGLELRAECAGSEYEPYQISVTLNAKGIAETSCTCPYDWGGICKHIVALLLAYVHNPQAIRIIEPLDQMLAGKSKADLIAIIQDLLRHQPNLISVVELTTQAQELKPGQPMNVSSYRTQARRALQHESSRSVERELKTLGETAARLARGGDVLNAGAIYHALLDETVKGYDDMISSMDEDGDIATIIDEFAKGLGKCLAQSAAETETRREWFESLLRAEIADIALGGIDLAPSACEAILKYANREEWQWLEERLSKIFSAKGGWAQDIMQEFLAKGRRKHRIKS
ncbi:MAG: SWIM zinc finger family protein [Pyrinomonadaceae bacterium]|nr:SWIM zinc finger family protein [Pyrinomonadaceae bacterium]